MNIIETLTSLRELYTSPQLVTNGLLLICYTHTLTNDRTGICRRAYKIKEADACYLTIKDIIYPKTSLTFLWFW